MLDILRSKLGSVFVNLLGSNSHGALELCNDLSSNIVASNGRRYLRVRSLYDFGSTTCPCSSGGTYLLPCGPNYTTETCIHVSWEDISKQDGLYIIYLLEEQLSRTLLKHDFDLAGILYGLAGGIISTEGCLEEVYLPILDENCQLLPCFAQKLLTICGYNGFNRGGAVLGTGNILEFFNSNENHLYSSRLALYEEIAFTSLPTGVNTFLLVDKNRVGYWSEPLLSGEMGFSYRNTHVKVYFSENCSDGVDVIFRIAFGLCNVPKEDNDCATSGVYKIIGNERPPCEMLLSNTLEGIQRNILTIDAEIPVGGGAFEINNIYSYLPTCCTSVTSDDINLSYTTEHLDVVYCSFTPFNHVPSPVELNIEIEPNSLGSGTIQITINPIGCTGWTLNINYIVV